MNQKELFKLAAQYGLDEEEAIDAILASIKEPLALAAFKAWWQEEHVGRWVETAKRQPELEGKYSCMRRGQGGRPSYLDKCTWKGGKWHNSRDVVITTVTMWWEAGEGA